MIDKKQVLQEIDRLGSIKVFVQAYEEIAASRMKRIRGSVLQTRDFLGDLTEIFKEVQASYKRQLQFIMQKKHIKDLSKLSVIKKNGKTVSVLIAANTGLYGDIVKKTLNLFMENVNKKQTDVVVIGRVGKNFLDNNLPGINITYFELPDNLVDQGKMEKIIEYLLEYERIVVYFGQFQNVINQTPVASVISDSDYGVEETEENSKISYIFEPSLERIMTFFETEIFASIFEQTVHESQLAKFASRMVMLDKAIENVRDSLKKVEFQNRIIHHRTINRKQLELLSGMRLWR